MPLSGNRHEQSTNDTTKKNQQKEPNNTPKGKKTSNDKYRKSYTSEEKLRAKLSGLDPSNIPLNRFEGEASLNLADPYSVNDRYIEFDNIIVGPKGVFNIEAKGYNTGCARVTADHSGTPHFYCIFDNGTYEERMIFEQTNRHINLLRALLGTDIPIHAILCFTDDRFCTRISDGSPSMHIPITSVDDVINVINTTEVAEYNRKLSQRDVHYIIKKLEGFRRHEGKKSNGE